jgi:hypothetical protein
MNDDATSPTRPLPYEFRTSERYSEAVFRQEPARHGVIILRGQCPRCAAPLSIPILDPVLGGRRDFPSWLAPGGDRREDATPLLCNCREPHPGRPADAIGCGAYWTTVL